MMRILHQVSQIVQEGGFFCYMRQNNSIDTEHVHNDNKNGIIIIIKNGIIIMSSSSSNANTPVFVLRFFCRFVQSNIYALSAVFFLLLANRNQHHTSKNSKERNDSFTTGEYVATIRTENTSLFSQQKKKTDPEERCDR